MSHDHIETYQYNCYMRMDSMYNNTYTDQSPWQTGSEIPQERNDSEVQRMFTVNQNSQVMSERNKAEMLAEIRKRIKLQSDQEVGLL